MSLTDELLSQLTPEEIEAYTADYESEEHIVVDSNRFVTVPESLRRIAVQYDHNVETVTFDCPRFWDGLDMSKMKVYINYMRADKARGMYYVGDVTIDETDTNIMHFNWTISNNATLVEGDLKFLVCIKKTDEDGYEVNHWNSELNEEMYVSEGLECAESIIAQYPDIITDLLTRMEFVETIATPEYIREVVDTYFASEESEILLKGYVYDYLAQTEPTKPENIREYVNDYLDANSPFFVLGPDKPNHSCLWFDTTSSGTVSELTGMYAAVENGPNVYGYDGDKEGMYAVVEGSDKKYNFDII